MKRNRNYTISERAIIAIGVKAGKGLIEINDLLRSDQERSNRTIRELNPKSYDMVKKSYLHNATNIEIWEYIQSPKTLGQLAGIQNEKR